MPQVADARMRRVTCIVLIIKEQFYVLVKESGEELRGMPMLDWREVCAE